MAADLDTKGKKKKKEGFVQQKHYSELRDTLSKLQLKKKKSDH